MGTAESSESGAIHEAISSFSAPTSSGHPSSSSSSSGQQLTAAQMEQLREQIAVRHRETQCILFFLIHIHVYLHNYMESKK